MTQSEHAFFLAEIERHGKHLRRRYVRAFGYKFGVCPDEVENSFHEGLFSVVHCVCRHERLWGEAEFYSNFNLTAWHGMVAARIATISFASNRQTRNLRRWCGLSCTPGEKLHRVVTLGDDEMARLERIERKTAVGPVLNDERRVADLAEQLDPVKLHVAWRYFVDEADQADIAREVCLSSKRVRALRIMAACELRRGLGLAAFPDGDDGLSREDVCLATGLCGESLTILERNGQVPPPIIVGGIARYVQRHIDAIDRVQRAKVVYERYYTSRQVAEIVGVPWRTLRTWAESGKLPPAVRDGRGVLRYVQAHVDAAIACRNRRQRGVA